MSIAARDWVRVFSESEGSYIERMVTEVCTRDGATLYRIDGFGKLKTAAELTLTWRWNGKAV